MTPGDTTQESIARLSSLWRPSDSGMSSHQKTKTSCGETHESQHELATTYPVKCVIKLYLSIPEL